MDLPSANLKINRNAFAALSQIESAINPYIVDGKFLVVDRFPKISSRDDLTRMTQQVSLEDSIQGKLSSYEFATHRSNSASDLVVLGMIIGINSN